MGFFAKKRNDYYPFGMPMPNRNVEGNYRYGYQGEYAEKDPETGHNAFQLRMWDSRIGRWLSPDPYGEFDSPYLGMGNNPISTVDPSGGCTDCSKCPDQCDGNGNFLLDTVYIGENIPSGSWGADGISYGGFENSYAGSTASYQQNWPEFADMNYNQMISHFEANYGNSNRELQAQLSIEEEIRRKTALAMHLMNFGRFLAMEGDVLTFGVKVPRVKFGSRNGSYIYNKVDIRADKYTSFAQRRVLAHNKEAIKAATKATGKKGKWIKVFEAVEIDGVKNEVHYFLHPKSGAYFDSKIKFAGKWGRGFRKGAEKISPEFR